MYVASNSIQGLRAYQEDRYINLKVKEDLYCCCIFDGHGGSDVSQFCKINISKILLQEVCNINFDIPIMLRRVFSILDQLVNLLNTPTVGTTAVLCLIYKDRLFFANAGDSMAMVGLHNGTFHFTTNDHKVDNPCETRRIIAAGGIIKYDTGMGRVYGSLNLARSIGDYYLKPWVISEPFIRSIDRKDVKYIFIASDGVWDVLDCEDVDKIIKEGFQNDFSHDMIVTSIIKAALDRRSTDNITGTLITL